MKEFKLFNSPISIVSPTKLVLLPKSLLKNAFKLEVLSKLGYDTLTDNISAVSFLQLNKTKDRDNNKKKVFLFIIMAYVYKGTKEYYCEKTKKDTVSKQELKKTA